MSAKESAKMAAAVLANPEQRARLEAMMEDTASREPVPDDFSQLVPFSVGHRVEVRTASGEWLPAVARSLPRYDLPNKIGRTCYLTVAVDVGGHPVNWPAEDVRAFLDSAHLGEHPTKEASE